MKITDVVKAEGDYATLNNLAKITNGLYNSTLYENAERYKKESKFYFYYDLCNILKENKLYRLLPSQTAQAVLQKVDGSIKSFIKLHKKDAKASFPHYHKKNSEWIIPFKSQQAKVDGNLLTVPMSMQYRKEKGIDRLELRISNLRHKGMIKYIELFKKEKIWYASIVVEIDEPIAEKEKNNLYIDLGIKNLAAIHDERKAIIYTGGEVRAIERYRNKKNAEIQTNLSKIGKRTSKKKRQLAGKLLQQLKQRINAMTKKIVETAKEGGKGIVVGDLSHLRDNVKYNKHANQQIHQWQFAEITKQLFYKSRMCGVSISKTSEIDTSKTCVLCGTETNGRIYRGLYRCKLYNKVFNADAAGASNIEKTYLQVPLQQGSGIGVVGVLAHPVVYRWNEHKWCDETTVGANLETVRNLLSFR